MYNDLLKDPVLRKKIANIAENPSGDAIAELDEQDLNTLAGGISEYEIILVSMLLGNKGKYCTLTKECQPCCN